MEDRPLPPHVAPLAGTPPLIGDAPRAASGSRLNRGSWKKDPLTGLHGQRFLCHAIDRSLELSRSRGDCATLALLQLENFYEIRSWVGISEADLLLADIAQLLKKTLPRRVLLCRCHNYEFAALLLGDASVNAGLITDKLKQALLNAVSPVLPPQLELKCGVGLAKLDANIPSWPVVFARARHNLRLAHYRGQLSAELSGTAPDVALKQLRAALACSELELSFQAWAHFDVSSKPHYEVRCALAAEPDSLPPALLFDAAARNALGEQLDRRIIEQSLSRLKNAEDATLRLVINLSHNSVVSTPFLCWLEQCLAGHASLAGRLVFQIGETDALIAQHHLNAFCEVIERLGSRISVSHFGCTPNPLRYLSLLPARYVKLDTTLLHKVDVSLERLESLRSLCVALHEKKIAVVAPMLETMSVLPKLWQARVDFLQGNCLQAPHPGMDYGFIQAHTVCIDG